VFCHHHDETEVYGDDPVPCPLCGLGGPQQADDGAAQPMFDDSSEALRHAMFDVDTGEDRRVHW
jgi:hypothetical protein